MNYSTMFNLVFDALNNGRQLVVADEWLRIFRKVCVDYNIDYVAEIHKGFYLVTELK